MAESYNKYVAQNGTEAVFPAPSAPCASQWIAVSERNPKKRGQYLAYYGNLGGEIRISNFGTSKKWDNGRGNRVGCPHKVTHWMELPEPPK